MKIPNTMIGCNYCTIIGCNYRTIIGFNYRTIIGCNYRTIIGRNYQIQSLRCTTKPRPHLKAEHMNRLPKDNNHKYIILTTKGVYYLWQKSVDKKRVWTCSKGAINGENRAIIAIIGPIIFEPIRTGYRTNLWQTDHVLNEVSDE